MKFNNIHPEKSSRNVYWGEQQNKQFLRGVKDRPIKKA